MGTVSQIIGYTFGILIMFFAFAWVLLVLWASPMFYGGMYILIAVIVFIFGFVIVYLGHRSRPTKEKEMLKMQAEEYFREQKLKEEVEKRKIEEMEEAEKEREKAEN
jgi:uncharacterized protein YacL